MKKETVKQLLHRSKSFGWRALGMFVSFGLIGLQNNLELLDLTGTFSVVGNDVNIEKFVGLVLGLLIGEVTKYLNQ